MTDYTIIKGKTKYWKVIKFGERITRRYFLDKSEALAFYDSLCKRNKNRYPVQMWSIDHNRSPYSDICVYSNDERITNIPYRDVSKKKQSKSNEFGLNFYLG